jgi:hypothetical protein
MTRTTILVAAVIAFAAALPAVTAHAQAIRTFVSLTGTDNSTCSVIAPCRHFQSAVNVTSVGGEVDALDPGAYGSFTISQAITINGQGWSYVAPPADGAAITVNAGSGNVDIRGVLLNGIGVSGANGIAFNTGNSLRVTESVIRNFVNSGIYFTPTTLTATKLLVSNSVISDNGSNGIYAAPARNAGDANVAVDHVTLDNNGDGLVVETDLQAIVASVSESTITNSTTIGIFIVSDGSTLDMLVRNCAIVGNATGLTSSGSNGLMRVTRSSIVSNTTGWNTALSGTVTTYADNIIDGNFSGGNNQPPSPGSYK